MKNNTRRTKFNWLVDKIYDILMPPKEPKVESHLSQQTTPEPYQASYRAWVTRDKCGKLKLHSHIPCRFKIFGEWERGIGNLPSYNFPNITWESGAVEVEFILKTKENGSNSSTESTPN